MTCPRCGFPTRIAPCRLCSLVDFDRFELTRFSDRYPGRFEFTFIVSSNDFDQSDLANQIPDVPRACTDEIVPRSFFFIADSHGHLLFDFISLIRHCSRWSMLINGRNRPYSQELWLPLFELSESR